MTDDGLKWIALLAMLCDHIGAVLAPQQELWRIVGRLSFPLYAWLLVQGFCRTRSRKKYALRLSVLALLSEVPFDLAFFGRLTWARQNIFVTLLLALGMLCLLERALEKRDALSAAGAAALMVAAQLVRCDYGAAALVLVAFLYLWRRCAVPPLAVGFVVFALLKPMEWYALLDVPLILASGSQNKRKGGGFWRFFFYLFYPLHLLVLCALSAR